MSKYDWERGTIKIPSNQYTALKKVVRDRHNALQQARYETLCKVYNSVVSYMKGKRGVKPSELLHEWVYGWNSTTKPSNFPKLEDWNIWDHNLLFKGRERKWTAPKKNMFPLATSSTKQFDCGGEAGIIFDDKNRTVTWWVSENNRAVERAHDNPLAIVFFNALDRIKWTSRTGGQIIGNDEYNRDADYAGGGGNYITMEYGTGKPLRRRMIRR